MEKIISVKEGKVVTKDDKSWIELIDQENHTHRVFPSMLGNDGVWVHLDEKVAMLKSKIEDGSIEGSAFKLIKEKKGTFWNVIGIEEIKNALVKEAQRQVQDESAEIRNRSVCCSYAKDLASSGVIPPISILEWADRFYQYITTGIIGGKVETKAPQKVKSNEDSPAQETGEGTTESEEDSRVTNIRDYVVTLGWVKSNKAKFIDYIRSNFRKEDIYKLTNAELTTLESALKEMAELK